MTQTFNFVMEPQPPASIDRADFIEIEGGRTRLVTLTTFESQEYRDGMLQSGMEQGMDEGYKKLDGLLADDRLKQMAPRSTPGATETRPITTSITDDRTPSWGT